MNPHDELLRMLALLLFFGSPRLELLGRSQNIAVVRLHLPRDGACYGRRAFAACLPRSQLPGCFGTPRREVLAPGTGAGFLEDMLILLLIKGVPQQEKMIGVPRAVLSSVADASFVGSSRQPSRPPRIRPRHYFGQRALSRAYDTPRDAYVHGPVRRRLCYPPDASADRPCLESGLPSSPDRASPFLVLKLT